MKAFIAYKLNDEFGKIDDTSLDGFAVKDPVGTEWRRIGLKPHPTLFADEIADGYFSSAFANKEQSILVAIVERILPSSTIKRHLNELKEEFERNHNQKVTKQQMAEWKEQFVNSKLPNCPLKETLIEVSFDFRSRTMLVGTSSQKKADDVVAWLHQEVLKDAGLAASLYRPQHIGRWLNDTLEHGERTFASAKLFNLETEEKGSFTNDINCDTARSLYREKGNMRVTELGLTLPDIAVFTITNKCVVKGIKYSVSFEMQAELDESESPQQTAKANHLIELSARREILKLFKEMENYNDEDEL